ncbi:hypothetical protein JRO89_XS07G0093300 [Xanthoceras sorbifolium]|uniref:Uncharacterized protein n=1 Tax=Xanthoceras sorbifolium TaxID=99658 RepID=A0ABQ8HTG2_9ROSI|nr:hypothetical protein JRO89_XS07G0093300 [Xanthoceras sorbifolium]
MMMLSQAPLTTRKWSLNLKLDNPNPHLITTKCNPTRRYVPRSTTRRSSSKSRPLNLTLAKAAEGSVDSGSATKQASSPPFNNEETVFVTQENVPLEGVIQFEKPDFSSRINKWGRVSLLAGGDVLALVLFSAIGRFNHGFSVFDIETLRTADPFIAGMLMVLKCLLSWGLREDGRGMSGLSKAVVAAAKSWALGIPLGLVIRAVTSGHIPQYTFVLVTMGSTAVLLIGWRALLFSFLRSDKKNDVYRRGNPFELFQVADRLIVISFQQT